MNTIPPNENDPALRAVLREWKPASSLPPRFQEQVWQRIERAEAKANLPALAWDRLQEWIAAMLPRPALALAYVTVLLVVGATLGWNQARVETTRVTSELGARYAQAVDPYQPTR
jgi:hypothetical protein